MQYMVRRGTGEYGPYTLADLRRFAQSSHLAPTDEVRGENEQVSYSASSLLGTEAWPLRTAPVVNAPGSPPPGAYLPAYQKPQMANGAPLPPKMFWGVVLMLVPFTCGMFSVIWMFMQTWWMRQLDRNNKAIWYLVVSTGCWYCPFLGAGFVEPLLTFSKWSGSGELGDMAAIAASGVMLFGMLASIVFYFVSLFQMREGLLRYFNEVENIGLQLNPVFTALGGIFYLQYHLTRIADWKTTGELA